MQFSVIPQYLSFMELLLFCTGYRQCILPYPPIGQDSEKKKKNMLQIVEIDYELKLFIRDYPVFIHMTEV